MGEKRKVTYIEFFDHAAVENICACLVHTPEKVVLIGDDIEELNRHCYRYEKLFEERNCPVNFEPMVADKNKLDSIVEALSKVVESNDDCVFGLTGGGDLYLVAMGIVQERYRDKQLKMHRFMLSEGEIIDCDHDGITIAQGAQPELSVEENIRLYGGKVVYDDQVPEGTHLWDYTDTFVEDVYTMWDICCKRGNRRWNDQITVLQAAAKIQQHNLTTLSVPYSQVESKMRRAGERMVRYPDVMDALLQAGMLTHWCIDDNVVEATFKDDQVMRCLTTAGQVLELVVYLAATDVTDEAENYIYGSTLTGVYIDWDGTVEEHDSHNEIDVMLMRGVAPIFVSCKNGYVSVDELYKLNVVAERFGSSYAKKVLVAPALDTYGDHAEYIRNRANDMNIQVVRHLSAKDREQHKTVARWFWYH